MYGKREQELCDMLHKYLQTTVEDNPRNCINHAAEYFTRLREANETTVESSKEFITQILGTRAQRRDSVVGEGYNPEEDDEDGIIEIVPKTDKQRNKITKQCNEIFFFRVLDKTELNAVINAMVPKTVQSGQIIINQGEYGDFLYLIDRGIFKAYIKDQEGNNNLVTAYLDEGYFGELALLHNQPRAATVKAVSAGLLWAVSRQIFNKLIAKRAFEKRQMYMELLNGVSHLKRLTEYEKMQIADAFSRKLFSPEETIFKEGDKGDGLYFIIEGKVSVRQKKASGDGIQDVEIVQLGKGYYFGELALVKQQPRAATVVAVEDTTAAFLEVTAFERLLGPCMDIIKRHTETYQKNKGKKKRHTATYKKKTEKR